MFHDKKNLPAGATPRQRTVEAPNPVEASFQMKSQTQSHDNIVGDDHFVSRSRISSLSDSASSHLDDSNGPQSKRYIGDVRDQDPMSILYSAVSNQFHHRRTNLAVGSLMEDLKRFAKRDQQRPSVYQSLTNTTLVSGMEPSAAGTLTLKGRRQSLKSCESEPQGRNRVPLFISKSPTIQYHLNEQFQDGEPLAVAVPSSSPELVSSFPVISSVVKKVPSINETDSFLQEKMLPVSSVCSQQQISSETADINGNNVCSINILAAPQQRVISASNDPVIVDPATAAAINLHNREETEDEEESTDSGESTENGFKSGLGAQNVPSNLSVRSSASGSTGAFPQTLELTEQEDSNESAHSIYAESPKDTTSTKQKKTKSPEDAWKRFSENIRKMGLLDPPSCSYSHRRPGASGLKRKNLLQQLILYQADKHGKYVQWTPSMELAFTSCAETEIVEAAKILTSVFALREHFHYKFNDFDSPAIFPAPPMPPGEGSTEPVFHPSHVKPLPRCAAEFRLENGVYTVYWLPHGRSMDCSSVPMYNEQPLLNFETPIPSVGKFLTGLKEVMSAVQHPACKTFTYRRLDYLRNRFDMHMMFNASAELQETQCNKHRDFYNVRKVDTHVHHSACMHQKHLLRFIRKKFRTEPDQVVARTADGQPVTLREIFDKDVGMTAYDASIDLLNVHALGTCFHRFDIFNMKYNPFGQALLREVFLKTDNLLQGRYLAELTKEVIEDLEDAKYQFVEWRISIYGKSRDEWARMAKWVKDFGLNSKNVRWMIQVPRLYHVYRKLNLVQNFGELLSNIFEPVFDAVRDPQSHPDIFYLLLQLNGWDSVDDESVVSKYTSEGGSLPLPEAWIEPTNPPYSYWGYYMYANIRSLNYLLAARGMRTLPFRPHCGETGSVSHLASMYLLADGINHGIMLRKSPVLQYLFYLHQIGLALSPLSNNALFHEISRNPFHAFFRVGLNVSLSTDDPLMFHFTTEPLLEEYSCCAHVWKLSPVDLCEIARNSILQSHYEPQLKRHWLGENYTLGGRRGNSISNSNVSNIRAQYREDVLLEELAFIRNVLQLQEILDELVAL